MHANDLTTDVLVRLTGDALLMFYSCAEHFHAEACQGSAMAVSGEPVADLNYLMLNSGDDAALAAFGGYVAWCDERELPFACMVAPGASEAGATVCKQLGLVYATDWPLMVCPGEAVADFPVQGVKIRKLQTEDDYNGMVEVLESAYQMPAASVRRAMPLRLVQSPSLDIYVAERDGKVLSTVTVTRHGEVIGVWAMGTSTAAQGQKIGKALLSRVMFGARQAGAAAFFLGATPAGFPLYQRLGYETLYTAKVWVRGETHQA
jgi:predicted N-acetyltransferase YhbS